MFSALAVGRRFTIATLITSDALPILGDRIQIQQVILNLVMNGIDAMKDRLAESRQINIRTARVENLAQLSVSDRGSGIPEDKFERGLRAVLHQQGGGYGNGTFHRSHHYRGAEGADIGKESRPRRRDISDQASSCPVIRGATHTKQTRLPLMALLRPAEGH